ncbi:methyl-accepting chemotaxis protein [Pseudoalteromonas luteoviolacea]|uniref:methyl-accepting chemotaxis protein n=1 Tax=Pseudoalteromonas luteoviolacea TaxID=43657 RepID=UPI001F3A5CD7|nr:methyl-accepting chemotaxis protein [Pseudoalteromonas luteoviolacea]MCF6442148.1 methyl-accepting chemotaxis protein [Pseudoalteromonas luteoviolacea]
MTTNPRYKEEKPAFLRSIRVKYSALFIAISVFFIAVVSINFFLISKTEKSLNEVGNKFNPAISAVINADRDLYQAHSAEQHVLYSDNLSQNYDIIYRDYKENAKQALERMNKYRELMRDYPSALSPLSGFDRQYQTWLAESQKVFDLMNQGNKTAAIRQSEGAATRSFDALRDYFNAAGEKADTISERVSTQSIAEVQSTLTVILVFSALVIALIVAIGLVAPKRMTIALNDLVAQLREMSQGDGDLTKRINSTRQDEIGDVANEFDKFISGLSELIRTIVDESMTVAQGVESLEKGAKHIHDTCSDQLQSIEVIVTAVNEMSYAIREVAENASSTAEDLAGVNRLTEEGANITNNTVTEINQLSEIIEHAAGTISTVSEDSTNITSVLDVIRGIAEQTNLLALNAAIEAARAGEQGKGFAVVADEVRTLASKTQQSTENIQQMIANLQSGVEQAVTSIEQGNETTHSTVTCSNQTLASLGKIASASQRVSDMAIQTATATEEQSKVTDDISSNLTQMSEGTRLNFDTAVENGEIADQTLLSAQRLREAVGGFKLS